jgi:hypothetical protein
MRGILVGLGVVVAFAGMIVGQADPVLAGIMLAVGTVGAVVAGVAGNNGTAPRRINA